MRVEPATLPSLKRMLIAVNLELDQLYKRYDASSAEGSLSEFEKLVVVLEDRRYFSHIGVDVLSVAREFAKAATFRSHGGASTIDMQFVRTVNDRKEYTLRRKAREIVIAALANYHFNKKAMLRSYLEIAFFGTGLVGATATSYFLFQKDHRSLVGLPAAQLAAMLVYPRPAQPSEAWRHRVKRRAEYGLRLLPRFEERFDQVEMCENIDV